MTNVLRFARRSGVALASAVALAVTVPAAAQAATVTTSGLPLTVRSAPTSNSAVVTKIPSGTHVTPQCRVDGQRVVGRTGVTTVWNRVSYNGQTGYVSASYVAGGRASSIPLCGQQSSGGSTSSDPTVATDGSSLAIRTQPSRSGKTVARIPNGARVTVQCKASGQKVNGTLGSTGVWNKVSYNGRVGWVSAAYVRGGTSGSIPTCGKGTAEVKRTKTPSKSSAVIVARGVAPSKDLSSVNPKGASYGPNGGYTPRSAWLKNRIDDKFGMECNTYRAGSASDHSTGNALDCWPGSSSLGYRVTDWVASNADRLQVRYQIFEQANWSIDRQRWVPMADRGDDTANHYDHIHISMQTPKND